MEVGDIKFMCIPVIDMQKLEDNNDGEQQQQQYKKLREASEEWGCFRIMNHKISLTLMSEMKKVVRELLDLPIDVKKRNTEVIPNSGYVAPTEFSRFFEGLGIYDFGSPHSVDVFCSQLDIPPRQREIILMYTQAIHDLAIDLGRMLARSVGLASELFKGWSCHLRINKYNFTPQTVGSTALRMHTDSGFLTILQDDENVSGLELVDKSGAFVSIDPWPGTLLVNLGDIAKVWSNGRFCNVKHRVQCKEASIRVSIASFFLGPKEAAVEAPPELVDSENPRQFVPFTYEDYRKLRLSINLHAGEALQFVSSHS
ncbi:2-oxoglutarate-dependent dioxygenase DAO-like [Quercus lobata]|nr:2-oxoglutarate-dependent dioxygenase DAO-like [Quercus lobata]